MTKPEKHILVCASFRLGGTPQGVCQKKGSTNLLGYLEGELSDRGMDNSISRKYLVWRSGQRSQGGSHFRCIGKRRPRIFLGNNLIRDAGSLRGSQL